MGLVILIEGDIKILFCVVSGNFNLLIIWYRDNVKVQEDLNNFNFIIVLVNKNNIGMYKCEVVVIVFGLILYRIDYMVVVIVRCKWNFLVSIVLFVCYVSGDNVDWFLMNF